MPDPARIADEELRRIAVLLPILERHAQLARLRGDGAFAEALEEDAYRGRLALKGHADG